ncbi:MAG: acyl carrier protein [Candidatus Cloacimonadaceae bacterium]|jgi:acyl carrier protein|nr:acyl carrier protein [Candidatus Cloacimonadota bacterium]MDY0127649.1 acyl carrier protein [Candidatus Cloacimonadaceae bacterium]MCB5254380.1 acyl carrier protein [Candidatus Cloacimonadota bacterium]MCK9178184.1 acyl carrier protein [Candidatus Cloacimonadota bacterium]MCK9241984.1 acyl carrier protein [Candidatus Cloacimonadota bacterium]
MEEKLLDFIRDEFLEDPELEIDADTRLISAGIIDSFSLVSLQSYIEREFGKRIPAPRITAESFDTVRQMVQIIQQF